MIDSIPALSNVSSEQRTKVEHIVQARIDCERDELQFGSGLTLVEDEIAVATGSSAMHQMKLGSWCCPLRRYDVRRWYLPNDLGNLRGRRGRRGRKQTELQAMRQERPYAS